MEGDKNESTYEAKMDDLEKAVAKKLAEIPC